jgi:cell division protein FtsW (lipid II flippase)
VTVRPTVRPRLRLLELALLVLASGIALVAPVPRIVDETGTLSVVQLVPVATVVAVFLALHITLVARGAGADPVLLPSVLALMGLSLALMQHVAPDLARQHWIWLIVALAGIAVTFHAPFDLRLLRRYRYTWALVGMGLVALTLVAGHATVAGGPRLWLRFGPLNFQPAESLKLLLVAFLAGYLEDKRELLSAASTRVGPLRLPPLPYLAPMVAILGVALALFAAQGDLGAALLLFSIALAMLYLASSRPAYVIAGLAMFVAGAYVLHAHLGIVQTRAAIWRDPWSDAQGFGYQIVQSLEGIAAGGVFGTGIGFGASRAIPAVHTDVIYSALVEQVGLAGAAVVLVLYALVAVRGYRIAIRAGDPFERLLAAGLTFALAVQAFIIIGGVTKVIPLTGVTLPFLSYGGSSLLASGISIALLLRISAGRRTAGAPG